MSIQISFQDAFSSTTAQGQVKVGQRASTPDGNEWVYAKASGTIGQFKVAIPNAVVDVDTVSSSSDQQGRKVYITEASAGWTVGAYANYWGIVDDGTGVGQRFRVKTNSTDTLTLYPEYALTTSLSVSDSDIALMPEEASTVIAAITSKLQNAIGICQTNSGVVSGDYYWLLTRGNGAVYAGEVLVLGADYVTGDDTTGQVIKGTTAKGAFDEQPLGRCLRANVGADQPTLVWVNIF
jgi:hypothetical protein